MNDNQNQNLNPTQYQKLNKYPTLRLIQDPKQKRDNKATKNYN